MFGWFKTSTFSKQQVLIHSLVNSLPVDFREIKDSSLKGKLDGPIIERNNQYGYKTFIYLKYIPSNDTQENLPESNFEILGIKFFSKRIGQYEEANLLFRANWLYGLKISGDIYDPQDFN